MIIGPFEQEDSVIESSPVGETQRTWRAHEVATLRDLLNRAPAVSAFCHRNPDGDTIGAAVAMALAARQMGCRAEVVSADPIPPAYAHLVGNLDVHSVPLLDPGLAIVCDAATLERIGPPARDCSEWFEMSTIVNVDHHITNTQFGEINLVDSSAAASCEVVARVLRVLGVTTTREIASAILAGIIRDSHGFSTAATTASTLRAAADAVDAGADLEAIYRTTLMELPLVAIDLWGRLLADVRREADDRIAWTVLTADHLAMTGAEQHHAEGVAELIARATGVEIGLLLREVGGSTRVSIRTVPGINAAAIAAVFDGGGHLRRAGCTIPTTSPDAIRHLIEECRRHLSGR